MRISYRAIIREAWEFTQENKKMIMVYAFLPALLGTLAGILYLIYQYYAILSSPLVENWPQSFTTVFVTNVLQVLRDSLSWSWPLIVAAIVVVILYLIIPSICEGAIVQLIARKRNKQDVRTRDGLKFGLLSFLPVFEYSWITRTFSIVSMISWTSFVARNLGWGAFDAFLPLAIFFAIVGIILTLIFTYTEYFIIIDDRRVIESIAKSSVLVITHLEETLLLSVLMLIISLRIVVQIVFVLLIPAIVAIIIYFVTSAALPIAAFIAGGVIGAVLLYVASYLNSIIHVFAASVWTFTFLELTHEDHLSARDQADSGTKEDSDE